MGVGWILKLLAISVMLGVACNSSPRPAKTVEVVCRTVERGDIEKAQTYFSSGLINRRGIGPLKTDLTNVALELKQHGGIKSIRVFKEDVVGDVAEVAIEVTRGNGFVASASYKLIKEKGEWRIDEVTAQAPGNQGRENE